MYSKNQSVLILYSHHDFSKKPMLLNLDECKSETFLNIFLAHVFLMSAFRNLENFIFERETITKYSCGLVLSDRMLIFGGENEYKKSLASLGSCELQNIGSLPFDFTYGACQKIIGYSKKETAVLCFHDEHPYKTCHRLNTRIKYKDNR